MQLPGRQRGSYWPARKPSMQELIPGALTAEQQEAEHHFSTPGETFRAKKTGTASPLFAGLLQPNAITLLLQ